MAGRRRVVLGLVVAVLLGWVIRDLHESRVAWGVTDIRSGEIYDIFGGWKAINPTIVGGYYVPNTIGGTLITGITFGTNTVVCNPWPNYHTGVVDQMVFAASVAGPAGSRCAQGIYQASNSPSLGFRPQTLLYADATPFAMDTLPSTVSAPSLNVEGGTLYWLCLWCDGPQTISGVTASQAFPIMGLNQTLATSGQPYTGFLIPSTFPATYLGSSSWPAIVTQPSRLAQLPALAIHFSN